MSPAPGHENDPVITGIGAITPLADSAPETWAGLIAGRSAVGPVTAFDASDLPVRIAAEIHGFDAEAALGPKRARRTARFSQLAIVAAREAVADAGITPADESERTAVVVNAALPGWPEIDHNEKLLLERGPGAMSPFFVPTTILNMAACEVR
jgi:3-oxoacyl-[acyl-carrier-protein] synthase II